MEYIDDLESGSSPRIMKAAEKIYKKGLEGYCSSLLKALSQEIEKPKAWKAQCQLIKAIGATGCEKALPTLKQLVDRDYQSTILYRELAYAIFILENAGELNLTFLYQSILKGNILQIAGACAGLLKKESVPSTEDIKNILTGISPFTENEGQVITPRCYIAAVAHLWPREETKDFLESCQKSTWPGLVEISQYALNGKASKFKLI